MLDFHNTVKAVFSPGLDTQYFDGLTLAGTPPQITSSFAQTNAWWLAELSRVIYRRTTGEDGMVLPDRRAVLEKAGLTEKLFVSKGPTQVALVAGPTFHALVFRGTEDLQDWLRNAEALLVPWTGPGKVHKGFLRALNEVWEELHPALQKVSGPIFYTGHSLGAAIAVLASAFVEQERRPLAVYTYGCPRAGNAKFAKEHPLRDRVYRIVNNRDSVPLVPPFMEHTGELHYITSDKRFLTNPGGMDVLLDRLKDDDTHTFGKDLLPEGFSDHAPVNYVAWMQRFANAEWVRKYSR